MMRRLERREPVFERSGVRFDISTHAHPETWAIVDLADWPLVEGIRWAATKRKNGLYVRSARFGLLHRYLLSAAAGSVVDHRDGNPLNNRRKNIRECSQEMNNQAAADRARGYAVIREYAEEATSLHVVRARLADGTVKEYAYPTRSKKGTKRSLFCKIGPAR